MKQEIRIKDNNEFEDIIVNGTKKSNNYYIIYYKERKNSISRFGITLSKKFGTAVVRNKYKRIVREIVRINQKKFKNDFDYIIIVKKTCKELNFKIMEEELLSLC